MLSGATHSFRSFHLKIDIRSYLLYVLAPRLARPLSCTRNAWKENCRLGTTHASSLTIQCMYVHGMHIST